MPQTTSLVRTTFTRPEPAGDDVRLHDREQEQLKVRHAGFMADLERGEIDPVSGRRRPYSQRYREDLQVQIARERSELNDRRRHLEEEEEETLTGRILGVLLRPVWAVAKRPVETAVLLPFAVGADVSTGMRGTPPPKYESKYDNWDASGQWD